MVRTGDRDSRQPTIAIITSQYHEKMAVDAMMTNRQTFVRYATVGQSRARGFVLFCDVLFLFCFIRFCFLFCVSSTQDCEPLSLDIIFLFQILKH